MNITTAQQQEIIDYLMTKRLPIDVLVEVNDHFVDQITNLENEGDTFEEAFNKVKSSWREDLKLYWDGNWNLEDTTNIARTINTQNVKHLFLNALKYTTIISLALVLLNSVLPEQFGKYLMLVLMIIICGVPFFNFIKNYKKFTINRNYPIMVVSVQQYTTLSISFLYFYFLYFERFNTIYQYDSIQAIGSDPTKFLVVFISNFIVLFVSIFTYLSQEKYLETYKKVEPYFKYIKS